MKDAYEEFAKEYPLLNLCADEALERRDLKERIESNSIERAFFYSLAGVVITCCTGNVPGIIISSASLYASLFASCDKK
jgi:hypothetical protein